MHYSYKFDAYMFNSIEEMEKYSGDTEVNMFMYKKICKIVNEKMKSDVIFYVNDNGVISSVTLYYEHIITPLKKCLTKFENQENYEMCIECLNMLKQLEK